jgi:hypothetical protein
MDDIEYGIVKLAEEVKRFAEQARGEEARRMLNEASDLLQKAASAHHNAP